MSAQTIQALMSGAFVAAVINAYVQLRGRKSAQRKTVSEAESLDRQSITTASGALAMANQMRVEAEAALAAAHKRIGSLEAFIAAAGLQVPT